MHPVRRTSWRRNTRIYNKKIKASKKNLAGSGPMCYTDWIPPCPPPFSNLDAPRPIWGVWTWEGGYFKKPASTFHLLEWVYSVLVCRSYCAQKFCQRKSWSFKAVSYRDYVSNPTPSNIVRLQKEVLTKVYLSLLSNNRSCYFIMWTQKQPIRCYKCNTKGYLGATSVLKSM